MSYRKFWLTNGKDEQFTLTEPSFKVFLDAIDGLGFAKTYATMRLGDKEKITSEQFNLLEVSGDVLFYDQTNEEKYEQYNTFVRFLSHQPIRLYYLTPNTYDPFYAEINFIQLDKSQVDDDGILRCPAKMKLLSFWQTSSSHELEARPANDQGKKYPLVRKIDEGYFYGAAALNDVTLYNDGTLDTGLIIEIFGECEDPQINFYQDGQYGACKLNGEFDYVKINSIEDEEEIVLKKGESVLANPLSYQDLTIGNPSETYVTFIKLRPGQSTITVTFGNTFTGYVKFSWRDYYVSV